MSMQTILVIGATGTAGGPVARQLLADGYHVRLLVRNVERARTQLGAGFEYIAGRVEESEAVQRALAGCGGVLADQAKGRVEQAIQDSGMSFTIFRPTYFMDNLPKHLQGKRAMVLGKQPHPLHLVAASDFGRMVSRAFQEPEAENRIFYVQGPEALTLVEALRLYCSLLEPEKQVMTIPLWAMSVLDTLFLGKQMRRTVQTMQVLQHYGELGDPTDANRLLGAPTTTLRAWCEQHRLLRFRESDASVSQHHPTVSREGEA